MHCELQTIKKPATFNWIQQRLTDEDDLFEQLIEAKDIPEIEQLVDRYYDSLLLEHSVDMSAIREFTIRMLAGMEKKIWSGPREGADNIRYNLASVAQLESLAEIKHYVGGYMAQLRDSAVPEVKESHRSIIKKTIYYMEQECQNATLNSMARKVYMTPTYLSMLFKANTGKTFIEQLTDIRMNKAKDMLRSTHLKNYEVAERVGYQDSRYFSQIFKKKVGVSPSEYRESIGR